MHWHIDKAIFSLDDKIIDFLEKINYTLGGNTITVSISC